MSLNDSRVVENLPHDEEVILSEEDSLLDKDETIEATEDAEVPGDTLGGTAGHFDTTDTGYDDLMSESDVRSSHDDKLGLENSESEYGKSESDFAKGMDGTTELSMEDLFQYIQRFQPQTMALETKLKPFIPDYFPSVGDVDEFLKVPRPDGKPDELGFKFLDEPAAKQSDPAVLNLQLRANSKQAFTQPVQVGVLEDVHKQPQKIDTWIQNIRAIQKKKVAGTVNYTKSMPDIDSLMSAWPAEIEQALKDMKLPNEHIGLGLRDLVQVLCNVLDIPVYDNLVESLHVLFTLYLEFKNNPYFSINGEEQGAGMNVNTNTMSFEPDA